MLTEASMIKRAQPRPPPRRAATRRPPPRRAATRGRPQQVRREAPSVRPPSAAGGQPQVIPGSTYPTLAPPPPPGTASAPRGYVSPFIEQQVQYPGRPGFARGLAAAAPRVMPGMPPERLQDLLYRVAQPSVGARIVENPAFVHQRPPAMVAAERAIMPEQPPWITQTAALKMAALTLSKIASSTRNPSMKWGALTLLGLIS